MLGAPKSLKAAKSYRYNKWAGQPDGEKYDPTSCAWEINDSWGSHQCTRKPKQGPADLYCWQHSDKAAQIGTPITRRTL